MKADYFLAALLAVGLASGCRDAVTPPQPTYIVDLSPPLNGETVQLQYGQKAAEYFGLKPRSDVVPVRPEIEGRTFGFSYFDLLSHAGAHLDSSARLLRDGQRPAEVALEKVSGWAHVVDVRWHDRASPISISDLEAENISADEIVILDVVYSPPGVDEWPQYSYLSESTAFWLSEIGIRALATNMPSLGSLRRAANLMDKGRPPEEIWSAHLPFFQRDIPVIEGLVNVDALLGQPRVFFVGFPLALADRSGAPMRAAGLIFESED